ncbi:MAG: MAPEG family protein [Proteobacteria bacterium]|nr:MAPEG family protein [Pseudomonadota bacterium]
MTTAYWCVLAAALLPYVATISAKAGARFDNRMPRVWLAAQSGWRARANAAQQNSFEAFPLFAVAVLVAHQTGAPQARVDLLAEVFVAARLAYIVTYIADLALLRSIVWFAGIAAAVTIFLAGT